MRKRQLFWALWLAFSAVRLFAGTVTGTLTTPNGTPLKNATLTFSLSQAGLSIGTGAVVPVISTCYTSTDGSIVEAANPLVQPRISTAGGGLPPGTYYAKLTAYTTDGHETLPSPEVVIPLPSGGSFSLTYLDPIPSNTQGVKLYVSATSGTETLQSAVTGGVVATQNTALVTGAMPPTTNSTVCSIAFNDTIIPHAGYKVSLLSSTGQAYPGFPQQWQLNGGANGTVNVSQGAPLWNGVVIYPQPIVAQPLNHGPQSISGPLSLSSYNLFNVGALGIGTAQPAFPLDVVGLANSSAGYLYNGSGGTAGQALVSDGTSFKPGTPTVTPPPLFYQTVETHGGALPQRGQINLLAPLQAADNAGAGRTDLSIAASGSGTAVPTETGSVATSTNCAVWDGSGGITASAQPCSTTGHGVVATANFTSCALITWGSTDHSCAGTATWSNAITGSYTTVCTINTGFTSGSADATGISQTTFGLNSTTSTTFGYYISNIHDAASGHTVLFTCAALQ